MGTPFCPIGKSEPALVGGCLVGQYASALLHGKAAVVARSLGLHRFGGVEGAREVMELRPKSFETYTFSPINTLGTNITNLPNDPGYFIGREPELATIRRFFEEGQSLVSLIGALWMGASRLAMRYALCSWPTTRGGMGVLQDVTTAGGMLGRIAQVLRLPIQITGIGARIKWP